ncbi:hypothetical protein FRC00_001387, partial [Tulasnella sp. 408]
QAATERLHNLNDSLTRTKDKSIELVHETRNQANVYTNNILAELEKVQTATLELPKNLQTHLAPVRAEIESSFHEITGIVKSDLPVGDKVSKVGHHVQEKVQPLLAQTTSTIQSYIDKYVGKAKEKEGEAKETVDEAKESANGAAEEATSS